MNDISKDKKMREGFVEANPDKPTLAHPTPEIQDSPAELDVTQEVKWPMVVKLSFKPITNNKGETIDELVFREPRGGDINRYGNPVRMNAAGDWVIEERKMHYIMAALADILPPFLDAMDTRDWNFAAYELMRFFLPTRKV